MQCLITCLCALQQAVGVVNVTMMQASATISAATSCKQGTPFAMITNMAVSPPFRRRGIAHLLMQVRSMVHQPCFYMVWHSAVVLLSVNIVAFIESECSGSSVCVTSTTASYPLLTTMFGCPAGCTTDCSHRPGLQSSFCHAAGVQVLCSCTHVRQTARHQTSCHMLCWGHLQPAQQPPWTGCLPRFECDPHLSCRTLQEAGA